ncbi:MAG: hypothetical protein HQL52_19745 [Magnetococcales bacterium]|nr:hypothetical protein [Magnetococcales bacterium]
MSLFGLDVALALAGGSIISGLIGADSAEDAAQTQASAYDAATQGQIDMTQMGIDESGRQFDATQDLILQMYNQDREDQAPFLEESQEAVGRLGDALYWMRPKNMTSEELEEWWNPTFSWDTSQIEDDPGYQFTLEQGLKALENAASAKGMNLSGAQLQALSQFAEGTAQTYGDTYYGRALDQYNIDNSRAQNTLSLAQSLAGLTPTSNSSQISSTLGSLGSSYGSDLMSAYSQLGSSTASNTINSGNATASSYLASSGLWGNTLSDLTSILGSLGSSFGSTSVLPDGFSYTGSTNALDILSGLS